MWYMHMGLQSMKNVIASVKYARDWNKLRRLLITTIVKHCRLYGYVEGKHEYHPLVSYSLYVFVLYIFFVDIYMLNVKEN